MACRAFPASCLMQALVSRNQLGVIGCGSKRFGVDPDAPRERRRMVMTLNIGDPAIEWLRPLPPDLKMIGPILPEPALALPADLEVCTPCLLVSKCQYYKVFTASSGERTVPNQVHR